MSSSWFPKLPNIDELTLYWISSDDNYIDKIILFGVATSLLRKFYLREVGSLSRVMKVGVDFLSVEKVFELFK